MKWFVLYQIISGDFEGVGAGACESEADRKSKEERAPSVKVELKCCHGPSTAWADAPKYGAEEKIGHSGRDDRDRKGKNGGSQAGRSKDRPLHKRPASEG